MLQDHDIICISSIDWDFIWQGHQQIMSTLATRGNRVLFIENTGVRAAQFRDLPRLKHRIHNWFRGTKGFRQERERLFVYSPILLPFPYSRIARWINRTLLLRAIYRWMRVMEFRRPILWTFLPTPLARELIRALNPQVTIYYCIDDLASSSPAARRISKSEAQFFQTADLVFVTSDKLKTRALQFRRQAEFFPFGVDFPHFERIRLAENQVPQELKLLPHPIIGYVGGIHQWIDQDLLVKLAKGLPRFTFVLVGPSQTDVSKLTQCPNVHLLGKKSHEDVPRYVKGFDVGIVPYRYGHYTAHVYPTKLNEYLAMGIPVVTTDLPEIRRFNAQHGQIVTIATNPEAFEQTLKMLLSSREQQDPITMQQRLRIAKQNSWDERITQMSALIQEVLHSRAGKGQTWTESLLRLYRTARQRLLTITVGLTVGYLSLFHSPLIWWLAEPLRMSESARPADIIVVFAGGVGESGKAGEGYQERVKEAVNLYREGNAGQILLVSGYTYIFKEGKMMKSLATSEGIPNSSILLEEQAATTFEYVTAVNKILQQRGWRSILLVSSPYHMRRAVWTWRKVAPEVTVIPVPVSQNQFYAHKGGASLEQIRGIIHEYLGLAYYWIRHWI